MTWTSAQDYLAALGPLVWQAAQRENFVEDVQAMRRRVIGNLPASEAARQLKLGPGGLRDIEFAVQLLQLVHGRTDETLREPGHAARAGRAGRRAATWPGTTRPAWPPPTGSCARWSTCCSSASCAARIPCRTIRQALPPAWAARCAGPGPGTGAPPRPRQPGPTRRRT